MTGILNHEFCKSSFSFPSHGRIVFSFALAPCRSFYVAMDLPKIIGIPFFIAFCVGLLYIFWRGRDL